MKYEGVYPGVDLVYYGNQGGQLEYDFVVAPGADPSVIALDVAAGLTRHPSSKNGGVKPPLQIDPSGDLVVKTDGGEVRFQKPVVYQAPISSGQRTTDYGQRTPVDGHYLLHASNRVGFEVGSYDRTRPLFIDPVLSYSTYLGGSGADIGNGIAVDSSGNAYVTGYTDSPDFPTANPPADCGNCGSYSNGAFVAKLNPAGSALVYVTFLGPATPSGVAVDAAGNAYLTGSTNSTDFPTVSPFQATCGTCSQGNPTSFVAKLNAAGSALVYSTYLGGSGYDEGQAIAVDAAGNAYVTGMTTSNDFPTVNPIQANCDDCGIRNYIYCDAFVSKLNPNGSALIYSTYLGGSGYDIGQGIAVDAAGNAYVMGWTLSTDFPTANPLQRNSGGGSDAFVAKLNPAGSALVYSTYLGGSGDDFGSGIAVDAAGNAYVTGETSSPDFPTANPVQPSPGGNWDAFVAKLNPAGSALVYSTYLGGSQGDGGSGIAVDAAGNAYVTGGTNSTNFPTDNPLQHQPQQRLCYRVQARRQSVRLLHLPGRGAAGGPASPSTPTAMPTSRAQHRRPIFPPSTRSNPATAGGSSDAFVAKIGAVTLSPTSLSFSNQMVGTTSPAQPVTVSNTGNANLTISSIAFAGSVTGDFAVAATGTTCSNVSPMAVGTSCTINVTFTPTIVGSESASLSVSDNITGGPLTVPLSGTGVLLPAPNVSPTSLSFNSQLVGTTSTPQPVKVTNTGTVALSISSLTISSGWTQSNNCLPSVAGNASCTINVSFQPTTVGSQTGTLSLTDNTVGSPQTVSLSGTGVAPVVSLSATSLSFPGQTVSTSSAPADAHADQHGDRSSDSPHDHDER